MTLSAGIPADLVAQTLRTFRGVEHRIEFVRELDGVRWINDSKGTNVDSTIQAVRAMKAPTVLILGGSPKKANYVPLGEEILKCPIEHIVLIGETAKEIQAALDTVGYRNYVHAGSDFGKALELCRSLATKGGNVLLSPACASFDMFDDYEARGRIFKGMVNAMEGAED